jgi:site-specific recombinase XerD
MKNAVTSKFKKYSTNYQGVRYSEHKTRKYKGKFDKCYFLRYKLDGKLKEEALGWSSDGWNANQASQELNELKKNQRIGDGPRTLKEKRYLAQMAEEAERAKKQEEAQKNISFAKIFKTHYLPQAKADKSEKSINREISLFNKWIQPVIGNVPLAEVSPINLEKIKEKMGAFGLSARSIQYALAVCRQVFNFAYQRDLFHGENPSKKVKRPKVDNRRMRFLTHEEADQLLDEIKSRSLQTYQIALISLHCGARADEIFKLKWADVDLENGLFFLWDTKNKKNRSAFMTTEVKNIFRNMGRGSNGDLVFTDRDGKKIVQVSESYNRAVKKLGFNKEIIDRRQKVVFHTLRHTFASWHVQSGTDLYTLQKLMGLSSFALVERYAHLAPSTLKAATKNFEKSIRKETSE